MSATYCEHQTFYESDECYTGTVSIDENRDAHGGVCHVQTCKRCGAVRRVNQNGGQKEVGPWVSASEDGEE
ncbi:MAG: hypothetical protein ABFD84_07390 [Candidatus Polarisedimenticolia bacterium]